MGVYTPMPFEKMTSEQHYTMTLKLLAMFITYAEGDTVKKILLSQDDDYMLKTIDRLKREGAL